MKNRSVAILIAAVLCAMVAPNARAQVSGQPDQTNFCNFFLQFSGQGVGTTSNNVTTTAPPIDWTLSKSGLISEIGEAKGRTFSKTAQLAFVNWQPWVLDGANSLIVTDMISFQLGPTKIKSGTLNNLTGLGEPMWGELKTATFLFNDSGPGFVGGSQYQFWAKGVVKRMVTDTRPNATTGIYLETDSGMEMNVIAAGYKGSLPIVGKGKIFAHGKNRKRLGSTTPTSEK